MAYTENSAGSYVIGAQVDDVQRREHGGNFVKREREVLRERERLSGGQAHNPQSYELWCNSNPYKSGLLYPSQVRLQQKLIKTEQNTIRNQKG